MARSNSKANSQQLLIVGLATAATVSLVFYWYAQRSSKLVVKETTKKPKKLLDDDDDDKGMVPQFGAVGDGGVDLSSPVKGKAASSTDTTKTIDDKTPLIKNTKKDEKTLHQEIEELDKKGKALFKNKQYLEAAEAFTEALKLIEAHDESKKQQKQKQPEDTSAASTKQLPTDEKSNTSLLRQKITLMNNRSAMYEKGNMPELALEDCIAILDLEIQHTKARTRKLRILEESKRWQDALIEVCAIQLLFMQANRENLRRGIPLPSPPVPQSKMEDILNEVLPLEMEQHITRMEKEKVRPLPSAYTILQLLKSYTGYNQWMALAAKDGSVDKITKQLQEFQVEGDTNPTTLAKRASWLMRRGRRHMYDRKYVAASEDFEAAYALVDGNTAVQEALEGDDYPRLLEWTGMSRHFRYDLDSALACYQKCSDLEPTNALLLVKQAGVQMDAGKQEEALKLFDTALGLDPSAVDALLHRSNLRMLQGKADEAKSDLEKCLQLRPNHVMARLRLASILAAFNDAEGAKFQLDRAEEEDPKSSEVQSYRGELYFTQNEMELAREQFEKAMKLEPSNPTPYVNAAMALLNTPPPPGQVPDAPGVMKLLEKAIQVDPQFTAAYIQLGQLKLGTATDLNEGRKVIDLYDQGLANCRSPEEVKELCSMRALAVAQVEAAQMLKMETFFLQ